ncbi:hypothetical protein WJX74_000721 [Apatococcus lobatus]|uniref:1-phosphatidylinositol 4-kinase n=1 Tax=Apatococcus lobatus TaxID=904363 RepID=A0AAW1QJM1_9CHLO
MAAAEVLASWGAALAALDASAGSKTCLKTCESLGPGSVQAALRYPDTSSRQRPEANRRLSFPEGDVQDEGFASEPLAPSTGHDGGTMQSSSNPHSIVGSAICLTALVHASGKDGVAAGKQLLACINALPLCGGQTALPTTQSFVGQLVALMLHLNRVLASPVVSGDLKRGISTAMLRLLAHSSGIVDSHPTSHHAHTPGGGDLLESVSPRAAAEEWPISAPLRAAVAKIALGHQRPIDPPPTGQFPPSGALADAAGSLLQPTLSGGGGASTHSGLPDAAPAQLLGSPVPTTDGGVGSGVGLLGSPGAVGAEASSPLVPTFSGGVRRANAMHDGGAEEVTGLPLLPIDADGLLQRLCGLLDKVSNQRDWRDGGDDSVQGADAGQILALSLLTVRSCMSASVGLARCLRAQESAFRVLRNEVLPALYDARFSPANPALPDPHLVEVLARLATSTCYLPVSFPISLPAQHSGNSQKSQPLAASSLPIPSTLLSTSGSKPANTAPEPHVAPHFRSEPTYHSSPEVLADRLSRSGSGGLLAGSLLDTTEQPGLSLGGWGSGVLQQASPERASPAGSTGGRARRQSGEAPAKQQRLTNRHAAIELVFEIAQAALSLALQGMIRTAVPMQVVASCLMSLQPVLVAEPSVPANTSALISGVIGMAGNLADNADRQNAALGDGGGEPWLWDLTHNLAPPLPGSRAPRSQHFPSPEQVCRMAVEAACGLLEVAWLSGQVDAVEGALLPLQALSGGADLDRAPSATSPCQQQALVLLTGRLVMRLQGQEQLLQVALPLLLGAWNRSTAMPSVHACLAHTLANVGIACAKFDHRWAFEQVVAALSRPFQVPSSPCGQSLLYIGQPSTCQGQLARALARLGEACSTLDASYRLDLEARLLALFAKMGFAASSSASEQTSAADLASLVAAIATVRTASSAGPQSLQGLQGAELAETLLSRCRSEDAQLVKAHRVLWLYIAVFDLAGLGSEAGRKGQEGVKAALGRLAASAPICLLIGQQASSERLEAELWERLQYLGRLGTSKALLAGLQATCRGHSIPQPTSQASAWLAHLLITAYINRCHALLAPPATYPQAVPVWPLLFHAQSGEVGVAERLQADWMASLLQMVYATYTQRLQQSYTAGSVTIEAPEVLARALIATLPDSAAAGAVGAGARSWRLPLGPLSFAGSTNQPLSPGRSASGTGYFSRAVPGMLEKVLAVWPGLRWRLDILRALLDSAAGAQTIPVLGASRTPAEPSIAHSLLQQLVARGGQLAPGHTDALLHELLAETGDSPAKQQLVSGLIPIMARAAQSSQAHIQAVSWEGSGAAARKAMYRGVAGRMHLMQPGPDANDMVVKNLRQAYRSQPSSLDPEQLADRVLLAAAAAIARPDGAGVPEIMRLICQLPGKRSTPALQQLSSFAFHWLLAACPMLQGALVGELCSGWVASVERRVGLFATLPAQTAHAQADSAKQPATGSQGLRPALTLQQYAEGVESHCIWLVLLQEAWQVTSVGQHRPVVAAHFLRMLHASFADPYALSCHAASSGAVARLLCLALDILANLHPAAPSAARAAASPTMAALSCRILRAALLHFRFAPGWYGLYGTQKSRSEAASMQLLEARLNHLSLWPGLSSAAGPDSMGLEQAGACLQLLRLLVHTDAERFLVWADPLGVALKPEQGLAQRQGQQEWRGHTVTAWQIDPQLALALADRFPTCSHIQTALQSLVTSGATSMATQMIPEAAAVLAGRPNVPGQPHAAGQGKAAAQGALACWAPLPLLPALALLSSTAASNPAVRAYALRSLHTCNPFQVAVFLPQLVQLLRGDSDRSIAAFLIQGARKNSYFAHILLSILTSEATPPQEAFNPIVKRSGWHPPADTGLWKPAEALRARVWESIGSQQATFLRAEMAFFDAVTDVSGKLYPVAKENRRAKAAEYLAEIPLPRADLYLPTNPESRIMALLPQTGTPMQSAAKVPLLVAFTVEQHVNETLIQRPQACIFKVGDDCRQDVLALQVIGLLKDAFSQAGLGLYVAPYAVVPTAYECGIVEVVPNCNSRAGLGETADGGLLDIFQREFGTPGLPRFEAARHNFVISCAGYAVASYLLQSKDRHNGNIMITNEGHLVHIDFGFILEISPGGNLGFESAAFKLSHEMTQILDPGARKSSATFQEFQELCIRGFLVARGVAEGVIAAVSLMKDSGLPCFGRGRPVENLRKRFHLEMNDAQAAAFMRATIADAYDKWTTGFYDYIQYLQNRIPK